MYTSKLYASLDITRHQTRPIYIYGIYALSGFPSNIRQIDNSRNQIWPPCDIKHLRKHWYFANKKNFHKNFLKFNHLSASWRPVSALETPHGLGNLAEQGKPKWETWQSRGNQRRKRRGKMKLKEKSEEMKNPRFSLGTLFFGDWSKKMLNANKSDSLIHNSTLLGDCRRRHSGKWPFV